MNFVYKSIPPLLMIVKLLKIRYWGTTTEWTFQFPGSTELESKKKKESKSIVLFGWNLKYKKPPFMSWRLLLHQLNSSWTFLSWNF